MLVQSIKTKLLIALSFLCLALPTVAQRADVEADVENAQRHRKLAYEASSQALANIKSMQAAEGMQQVKKLTGFTQELLTAAINNAETAANEADSAEEEADYFCEEAANYAYYSEDDLYDAENAFKKCANDLKKAVGVTKVSSAQKFLEMAVKHLSEGRENLMAAHEDLKEVLKVMADCQ